MLAVIKTGGKQYIVSPGDKIKIEKLDKEEGSEVKFSEVLLLEKKPLADSKPTQVEIGTPFIEGVKVIGKVLKQAKDKKVIIFKYKSKKRYRVKKGHRQQFTEVEINKIESK